MEQEAPSCRLFAILCKSSSLWEKESPREEQAFRLRNFNFFETCRLYPDLSLRDQLLLYSVTGGNPGLLEYFSPEFSVCDNLEKLFFQEKGSLYRLVPGKLQRHYGNSPLMGGILAAIGSTPRHLQEICDRTELTPSAASSLLSSLEKHGMTEKLVPVTEPSSSRRALYRISDSAFRFWYTCIYPFQGEIETEKGREIFHNQVLPGFSVYLKAAFEDICRDFLRLDTEYIPIAAAGKKQILLGACFLTEDWLDADALSSLQKHAGLFPDREKWYYLFSTSDFVSGFEAISGSHVRIFRLEDMCRTMNDL